MALHLKATPEEIHVLCQHRAIQQVAVQAATALRQFRGETVHHPVQAALIRLQVLHHVRVAILLLQVHHLHAQALREDIPVEVHHPAAVAAEDVDYKIIKRI